VADSGAEENTGVEVGEVKQSLHLEKSHEDEELGLEHGRYRRDLVQSEEKSP